LRFNDPAARQVLLSEGERFMEARPDGTVLMQTALSMSRVSDEALPAEAAEVARLVRLTLSGDASAFEQIVIRYESRVMTLAARLLGCRDDAPDVAQEVFLRAFKYLHRADPQKPLEPWLLRIAVNVCRDAARRQLRRQNTFVEAEGAEPIDGSIDPCAGLERQQERGILQRALGLLPEKERLAIVLRDIEGLSTAEVAAILQSSETTVRSQVSRGRLRLKAAVDRLVGGES
jgi:RNA polymerase sigma-70 factor (ECF subfamily)